MVMLLQMHVVEKAKGLHKYNARIHNHIGNQLHPLARAGMGGYNHGNAILLGQAVQYGKYLTQVLGVIHILLAMGRNEEVATSSE